MIGSKSQTTQRKNFCARLEEVTQKNTRKHSGALCIAFSAKKKQLLNSANQSRTTWNSSLSTPSSPSVRSRPSSLPWCRLQMCTLPRSTPSTGTLHLRATFSRTRLSLQSDRSFICTLSPVTGIFNAISTRFICTSASASATFVTSQFVATACFFTLLACCGESLFFASLSPEQFFLSELQAIFGSTFWYLDKEEGGLLTEGRFGVETLLWSPVQFEN